MCEVIVLNYEQRRLEYFKEQKAKAERSLKYWSERAAKANYISRAVDMASDTGEKVMFYTDAINAFQEKHGHWIHDINNLYGCSECTERETMSHRNMKRFCPNCGVKMYLEVQHD